METERCGLSVNSRTEDIGEPRPENVADLQHGRTSGDRIRFSPDRKRLAWGALNDVTVFEGPKHDWHDILATSQSRTCWKLAMSLRRLKTPNSRQPFETYEICSLADLMRLVRRRQYSEFATIYRGQTKDIVLIPKVGRLSFADRQLIRVRPSGLSGTWSVNCTGHVVPRTEREMLLSFERMALGYVPTISTDRWEVLAIAQHHGLPTRLLDWSYNPFVAAWFAVNRPPVKGQGPGVIWIHVPEFEDYVTSDERTKCPLEFKRPDVGRPVVFEPKYVTARIRAQDGLFTVHQFNERRKAFMAADRFGSHRQCMTKALIPSSRFESMRDELDSIGVHAAALFPDLDGLARKIADSFSEWP